MICIPHKYPHGAALTGLFRRCDRQARGKTALSSFSPESSSVSPSRPKLMKGVRLAETEQVDVELDREAPPKEAGFIRFYGLYWDKSEVGWLDNQLLGRPPGWVGRGVKGRDPKDLQMNFWKQQGVYILYDANLQPVYAGQAGLSKRAMRRAVKISEAGCCTIAGAHTETAGRYFLGSGFWMRQR